MPREKTAYKELRKAVARHAKRKRTVSELKTIERHFEKLILDKKLDDAKKMLAQVVSKIDRAASKGIIKNNTASRKISRLMKNLSRAAKA